MSFRAGTGGPTLLSVLDLVSDPPAPPWRLNDISPAFRPDWCWATGKITFMDPATVYVQDTVSATPISLPKTPNMAYPTWSAAGDFIVTESGDSRAGYPSPRTTKIDPASGAVIAQVMGSPLVWGGMPTVDLRDSARIAFAGQWIGGQTDYNQDRNYIWLADDAWQIDRGVAPVRPLDPQANAKARSGRSSRAAHRGSRRTASGSRSNPLARTRRAISTRYSFRAPRATGRRGK
jgi:hypothetical protein